MPALNSGSSVYHSVHGYFCRGFDGRLLAVEGRNADDIRVNWPSIWKQLQKVETGTARSQSHYKTVTTKIETACSKLTGFFDGHTHHAREMYDEAKGCFVGLLACQDPSSGKELGELQDWIEIFFLLETTLRPLLDTAPEPGNESYSVTEKITTLFENSIRNIASNDEWHASGREHFFRRVFSFVARNDRIEFGLPAFPCKSPNTRKVGGTRPDMAERMALVTLRTFAMTIRELYPPGATLWVISDGHVFSDCSKSRLKLPDTVSMKHH
jgi:hypothetical protein